MNFGMPEMLIIFVLALILFGPKKLPEIGRTIGKAVSEFRRATDELKTSLAQEVEMSEDSALKGLKEDFDQIRSDLHGVTDVVTDVKNKGKKLIHSDLDKVTDVVRDVKDVGKKLKG